LEKTLGVNEFETAPALVVTVNFECLKFQCAPIISNQYIFTFFKQTVDKYILNMDAYISSTLATGYENVKIAKSCVLRTACKESIF
jgi:hypothetical protein